MTLGSWDLDEDDMARIAVAVKSGSRNPIEVREAEAELLQWQMEQQQRQTIALERIADRLTPVAVINTPPDQAAQFPEIQP